ncbi:unnamed protein product [Urochloa humidicola]
MMPCSVVVKSCSRGGGDDDGRPHGVLPGPGGGQLAGVPLEGLMFFVRSCAAKGGVDLFAALHDEHADAFKEICYSLDW